MTWQLIVGLAFFMPYLARLPGAITRGPEWFWSYLPSIKGFLFFGAFNLIAIVPLLIVGVLHQSWGLPIAFAATAIAYAVATYYFHRDYDLASDAQAAIGLVILPLIIFAITAAVAAVASGAELMLAR